MNCAVIGLGKLGLPLAGMLHETGNTVLGLDYDHRLIESLQNGSFRSAEPDLMPLLRPSPRLSFTGDYARAVQESHAAFIVVPTPSHHTAPRFSLKYVKLALDGLLASLFAQKRRDYQLIVVSTVMPGACQNELWPQVLKAIPDAEDRNIQLYYSPEFIALGSVLQNMRYPDMILVGAQHTRGGYELASFLQQQVLNGAPTLVTGWVNAELAKLGINSYLGLKMTMANMLGRLAGKLPGADVDKVTDIMGHDSRIGPKYLRSGAPFGGPCLPRDLRALEASLVDHEVPGRPILAVSHYNEELAKWLAQEISRIAGRISGGGVPIGLLGFTYKSGTPVMEESPAQSIAAFLSMWNHPVHVFDESLPASQARHEYRKFHWHDSAQAVLQCCPVLVLPKFSEATLAGVTLEGWSGTIFDLWRQRPQWAGYPDVTLILQGIGPPPPSTQEIKDDLERVANPPERPTGTLSERATAARPPSA